MGPARAIPLWWKKPEKLIEESIPWYLRPSGTARNRGKTFKTYEILCYPLETLESYSPMEVNGCRQKRGLDVKFASKLDFSAEALVACELRLITVSSKWVAGPLAWLWKVKVFIFLHTSCLLGRLFSLRGEENFLGWNSKMHWGMSVKNIRWGDQTFALGRVLLDLFIHGDVFKFIPRFEYFALAWIIDFSNILIFTT